MSNSHHIVVVDGYTLNPGDLSWQPLCDLAPCEVFERTPPPQLAERAHDATIVLTNKVVLDAHAIAELPQLQYVGVSATGYNVVDLDAARARGIVVTNVPTYSTDSVAQMTFAHLLNLTQQVGYHAQTVREGRWSAAEDFCFWDTPQVELAGLKLGVVGFGRIGRAVARLADAFGMQVLATNRSPVEAPAYVTMVELETLFRECDVVSLHCPLAEATRGMVDAPRLATMKRGALLINTSRGPLVDERALADALESGQLGGAGLDVLDVEPPPTDDPLLTAPNCFITPHIAWATRASRSRLMQVVTQNVAAFLAGTPRNVVS
jgi:glycerate dehydrogenase